MTWNGTGWGYFLRVAEREVLFRAFVRSKRISSMWSLAHWISWLTMGNREWARLVSRYSTLGGTSANTRRSMKPSVSSVRRVRTSIFCDISRSSSERSLNLIES